MKRILMSILIIILAVGVVVVAAKNSIAKIVVEKGVEMVTGLQLTMQKLNISFMKTFVGIDDLKLYNPAGYQDRVMLNMPEIYVNYNLPALMKGKVHLYEMRLNMKEFVVVKNRNGELNLNSLKVVKDEKEVKEQPAEAQPKKEAGMPEIQIDVLDLKVGKVIYKDYSKGGDPVIKEFQLNISKRFENIDDPKKIVSVIVVQALMNTTIARLANFDLGALQSTVSDTLANATKIVGDLSGNMGETLSGTTQEAQQAVQGATEAVKDTAKDLQGLIKLPFGGEEEKK